jgi:hypothetical protein
MYGPKIDQHFPIQGPPKFSQIWIFGSKRNHLATLASFNVIRGNKPTKT